jgi:triosephosphate isomerase (TIM)
MIFVNFKTYQEGSGPMGVSLVSKLEEVTRESGVPVIPVVQVINLKEIMSVTKLPVWVQHVDGVTYGAYTGSVLPEEVVRMGARGTILNHSERRIENKELLAFSVSRAKEVGLEVLVCAQNTYELAEAVSYRPTYVAYEPPEFIGNTQKSVSSERIDIVAEAVDICNQAGVPLLVGAGVHNRDDVRKSVELGARGILLATYVMKADDPYAAGMELAAGFKQN